MSIRKLNVADQWIPKKTLNEKTRCFLDGLYFDMSFSLGTLSIRKLKKQHFQTVVLSNMLDSSGFAFQMVVSPE